MLKPHVVLAIETSTSACSVALQVGGNINQLYQEGNNLHSKCLLIMVDQLLNQFSITIQDIELIAAGVGPGAFTGLRIGVGVAQGLAYSHSIPVVGVSSLQALAMSVDAKQEEMVVIAGLDARMSEIYWTVFRKKMGAPLAELLTSHQLGAPQSLEFPKIVFERPVTFIGNAWLTYLSNFSITNKSLIEANHTINVLPQAKYVLENALNLDDIANIKNCFELGPLYIRNDIAKKKTTNPLLK